MDLTQLLQLGQWIAAAGLLVAGAGISAAAVVELIKRTLAKFKVVLPGVWAGALASAATILIVAQILFVSQDCPLWIAILASVIAVFMPHVAYNTPRAAEKAVKGE